MSDGTDSPQGGQSWPNGPCDSHVDASNSVLQSLPMSQEARQRPAQSKWQYPGNRNVCDLSKTCGEEVTPKMGPQTLGASLGVDFMHVLYYTQQTHGTRNQSNVNNKIYRKIRASTTTPGHRLEQNGRRWDERLFCLFRSGDPLITGDRLIIGISGDLTQQNVFMYGQKGVGGKQSKN